MDEKQNSVVISIVIPVYNEEENLKELHTKLSAVLSTITENYEILFIDDGSTDNSFAILKELNREDKDVKVIKFRRNFGKSIALNTAFRYAIGDIIITMDGDLQDDPEELPKFIEKIGEGYGLVVGWKYPRKDPITKKIASKIFNRLTGMVMGVDVHDFNCGYKAFKRKALENIYLYGEMHRYIPALIAWQGFRITELKVKHHPREYGKSKYGATRIIKGFLDLITVKFLTGYATRPLHVFGIPGILSLLVGFFIGLYLAVLKYWKEVGIGNRPLLLLSILLIILGLQFISIGLLGEMITFHEITREKGENVERYIEEVVIKNGGS
jgi:glycosyltransferase involved in cell wall biosynthesis